MKLNSWILFTTRKVSFRLSQTEHARVAEYVSVCGLTMSELARKGVLSQRAIPKTDLAILAELRRLGGLLKHVHNESLGAYSALTAQAIRDLSAYARALTAKHYGNAASGAKNAGQEQGR